MKKYYHIGEISKLYNIGIDSLRYYEKLGIIKPERSESNYRLYSTHDIWRLNVIRDLRELGFSLDYIKDYFKYHTLKNTYDLLALETDAIDQKIKKLKALKENVKERMKTLKTANNLTTDEIIIKEYPKRACFSIHESYEDAYEMDLLIKRLVNIEKEYFYIIGNNDIGTAIPLDKFLKDDKLRYEKVFILSKDGNKTLEGGRYLSYTYRGEYAKSKDAIKKMVSYAKAHDLELANEVLEILWVEIHTTSVINEYVTELQVRIIEKNL